MFRRTLVAALLLSVLPLAVGQEGDVDWPREFENEKGRLVLYQPQITGWEDFERLEARMAIAFAPPGAQEPTLGTMLMEARTDTNLADHLVRIYDIRVREGRFPTLNESRSERLIATVLTVLPEDQLIALERVLANLERGTSQRQGAAALNVEPPKIFVNTDPAILIQLDGEPILAEIEKSDLRYALNTNWDLFELDDSWYLRNDDAWYKAAELAGPWKPARKLPKAFKKLDKKNKNWDEVRANLPGKKIKQDEIPIIYHSTTPAELILIDGEPTFAGIEGTGLLWADNTDADLYATADRSTYYYLVSGRWFSAASLEGPWKFATPELPEDFLGFPTDHTRARIRSSIPGTDEALEASLLAQIPQKATVKRDAAKPEVTYSGDPDFQPIEGTELTYAVNTQNDVIRSGDIYYVCFQGIWFASTTPNGPWEVADKVADEIYTIPPTSPVYHTTNVYVYDSTPSYVTVGYTAGYMGLYVSYGCVTFGTGWYYPPYYHYGGAWGYPIYYPYPYSYGMAAYYNPYNGTYGRGMYGYGPYGGWGAGAAYNPSTGTYARGARAYSGYNSAGWAQAYNPRTGTSASTYQRSTPYSQWGESVVRRGDDWAHTGHYSDERGTVGGIETSRGGKAVGFSGDEGRGFVGKDGNDNVYAGKDGNVYRHDEGGGWSKYGEGGWEGVDPPDKEAIAERAGEVDRDAAQERASQVDRDAAQERASQVDRDAARERASQADRSAAQDRASQRPSTTDRSRSYDQLERDRQARSRGSQRTQQNRGWSSSGSSGRGGSSYGGSRGGRGGGRRR